MLNYSFNIKCIKYKTLILICHFAYLVKYAVKVTQINMD